ncbi:hypothetical protein LF1_01060 [Rubripirellula obstinata]|uniref:Uncharacterized protein n=1 Tax=Rubripirellula obstinata TaxID=406547 RepID=A0A5B1C8Z3_9BACT|nr:hypothetical protein LF1_01060 [Rubripirellula obstinata]
MPTRLNDLETLHGVGHRPARSGQHDARGDAHAVKRFRFQESDRNSSVGSGLSGGIEPARNHHAILAMDFKPFANPTRKRKLRLPRARGALLVKKRSRGTDAKSQHGS